MKALLLILLTCLSAQTMAATYRWVDETGQVHYSDRPQEGAQEVEVKAPLPAKQAPASASESANRTAGQGAARSAAQRRAANEEAAEPTALYSSLRVIRPGPEETFRNLGGSLLVSLSLQPRLLQGHSVRVYYDGRELTEWPPRSLSFTLSEIYRGEHNLRAAVVDAAGNEVLGSESVTFFVHQASVQNRPR